MTDVVTREFVVSAVDVTDSLFLAQHLGSAEAGKYKINISVAGLAMLINVTGPSGRRQEMLNLKSTFDVWAEKIMEEMENG